MQSCFTAIPLNSRVNFKMALDTVGTARVSLATRADLYEIMAFLDHLPEEINVSCNLFCYSFLKMSSLT